MLTGGLTGAWLLGPRVLRTVRLLGASTARPWGPRDLDAVLHDVRRFRYLFEETPMSHALSVGDRVLYRIGGPDHTPVLRPADVVEVAGLGDHWMDLAILTRGSADLVFDRPDAPGQPLLPEAGDGLATRLGVERGSGIGEWRTR